MPQYQGVWTLPVAARLQSNQQWATDPLYRNTTLLLQADNAANGAQNNTFLDSSSNSFAITRNGNTTQGTFTPFSATGWGNYFDGASGTALSVASATAFDFGTGDFTIECFAYVTSQTGAFTMICATDNINQYWGFGSVGSGGMSMYAGTAGTDIYSGSGNNPPLNQWNHLVWQRSSGVASMYLNGVRVYNAAYTANFGSDATGFRIGQSLSYANYYATGYISNLRVVRGSGVYSGATITVPISPLTAVTNTQLLTCQSNRFVDNSTNAFAVTVAGNPSVQAFSPFAPQYQWTAPVIGGSGYFDGTGDYLTGNGVLVTTTTANTFSCEGWFYPTTFANLIWLVGDMDATGGTNNVSVDISTGGAVELYWWDGSAKRCTSTSVMRLNQWNYFAIVVNAGVISIYVNSTTAGQSGTTTLTNRSAASQNFSVGQFNNSTTPNGYVGSLRWSTSARTISSIPTTPYTADANTRLLLNFTNAGIYDGTMKNNLETVGNAQINTSVVKYGTGSMAFDGTGDWCLVPSSQNFNMGTGDWTVECWALASTNTARGVFQITTGYLNSVSTGIGVGISSTAGNPWRVYHGTTVADTTSAATIGVWNHVAFVRFNGNVRLYINGTSVYSVTDTSNLASYTFLTVGAWFSASFPWNGYIDDFRITKGVARYIANFTPPTVALPRQ